MMGSSILYLVLQKGHVWNSSFKIIVLLYIVVICCKVFYQIQNTQKTLGEDILFHHKGLVRLQPTIIFIIMRSDSFFIIINWLFTV